MTAATHSCGVAAFLPVKGQSDRVANKNIRSFSGEPFFLFTLRKLLRCDAIDAVFIDSEDETILHLGEQLGAIPLPRDPSLATNQTDGHELFWNEVRQVDADIYVQSLCTSPFVRTETMTHAIEMVRSDTSIDSVVLGHQGAEYRWADGHPAYGDRIPNSVDLPTDEIEGMSLYVVRGDVAKRTKRRIGERPRMIHGEPIELIDVNTEADFSLAECVATGLRSSEARRFRFLNLFLSTAMLSDVLDEFGHDGVLANEYSPNYPEARLFGRARPISIRACEPDENAVGIYDALQSYQDVVSNDVIVLQTDLPDYAYFGELNMTLAMRCGAIGAVIGGTTRDSRQTSEAGFPVFAKGTACRDIKGRGTVRSMNMPIELDGITIEPDNLVVADSDGIVVVPRRIEDQVLARAIDIVRTESNIMADVCRNVDIARLIERHGFF